MSQGYSFRGFAPRPFDMYRRKRTTSDNINDVIKSIYGLHKTLTAPESIIPKESSPISGAINNEVFGDSLNNSTSFVGDTINSTIANDATNTIGSTVGGALGKAAPVVGGVFGAKNTFDDFKKGNTVDGVLNGVKTVASFIPAAAPIAAGIGVAQSVKNLFSGKKNNGQAALNRTMQESENALNNTNNFAKNMQQQDYSQQMLPTQGQMTGGAAPVQQQLSPIQEYQNYLRSQGYDENIINGIPQGLNGGNKEIADWINQYNSGAGKDNPINIPQTEEDIAAAKAGSFNIPTQTGNAEATLKQSILDKFLNGIGDLASGFQENRNNGFKAENLQRDDSKSKMNRIGEALGTTARIAQNPLVQGLVAGGLSTALTGNPLFGLGKGYEFANNRAMSNLRAQALRDYGINAPDAGMFGNYSSNDFNTIGNLEMKNITNQLLRDKLAESENYHRGLLENKENALQVAKDKMAADNNYKAQKLALDKERVAAYKDSVKNRGGNPEMNSDLAEYFEIMKGSDENAKNYARKTFITRYGKDPDKLFKSDDTTLLLQALLGD